SASSARRCQDAKVMSAPIPAGSPSVSPRGSDIAGVLLGRARLDQRLAAQLLQIPLRLLLEFLVEQGFLSLLLARGVVGLGGVLGADREHLDAERGDFRGRQLADRDAVEALAQIGGAVGRAGDDLIADRPVLEGGR